MNGLEIHYQLGERDQIRPLIDSDVAAALDLSLAAGWNQTADDWRMMLALAPDGCFAIEVDDHVVATATLLCYGRNLGWIGMVLTKPEHRGRGFARRLLTHALDRADALGLETVKLDATDQGEPLYKKLGFRAEQSVERWTRGPRESVADALSTPQINDASRCRNFDAFGADRSQLLRKLAARRTSFEAQDGFLFSRPGRIASHLGPCVAADKAAAGGLIEDCLRAGGPSGWCWDLLPANQKAVALAESFGFAPKRRLLRMVRGKGRRGKENLIYAIAGFEFG